MDDVQEYEQLSKNEARKFKSFLENEYKALYPVPRKERVSLGWKFTATTIVSIAQVVLAAFRTSQMFYNAAALSGGGLIFSVLEAGSALLAIEGALVVYSAILASKRDRLFRAAFWVQIGLTILVSTAAGTTQSLSLIQTGFTDVVQRSTLVLAFILGIGSTAIAWLGGDILGQQVKEYQELKDIANERYERNMQIYFGKARRHWSGPTESNPKVNESFAANLPKPKSFANWRKIRPQLSDQDIYDISTMETIDLQTKYGLEERTAQNWKVYAKQELNNG